MHAACDFCISVTVSLKTSVLMFPIFNDRNNDTERRNWRFLQSPHCAANCLQHVHSSGQGVIVCNHVQHQALTMCNICAMW